MQLVHEAKGAIPRERMLRLPQVEATVGLKRSTIYELMKRGAFPRSVKLSQRCVVWPESRVLQFVQDRIAASDALGLASAEAQQ
jgi:prophage regulatory protein